MSLVIDANSSNGGLRVSNASIIPTYPDFEHSLLMFPNSIKYSSYSSAFSVNGTNVFDICGTISEENYFGETTSVDKNYTLGVRSTHGNNLQLSFNYAIDTPIDSGLTIGKRIVYPRLWLNYYQGYTAGGTKIQAGLLHTDGTITYLGSGSTYSSGSVAGDPNNYMENAVGAGSFTGAIPNTKVETTVGTLTQEGDLPMFTLSFTTPSSYGNYVGVVFGTLWTKSIAARVEPLQVSVD